MSVEAVTFRFDQIQHEYILDGGVVVPSITQMLKQTGHVDDVWFSAESAARGQEVHRLTKDYDEGALTDGSLEQSGVRGYVLAHIEMMRLLGHPRWEHIEVPFVNPTLRFGGRPDRVGYVFGVACVLEIKSGVKADVHTLQTAMQAILIEPELRIPAERQIRYALYLKANGRSVIEDHPRRQDLEEARRIIRQCT